MDTHHVERASGRKRSKGKIHPASGFEALAGKPALIAPSLAKPRSVTIRSRFRSWSREDTARLAPCRQRQGLRLTRGNPPPDRRHLGGDDGGSGGNSPKSQNPCWRNAKGKKAVIFSRGSARKSGGQLSRINILPKFYPIMPSLRSKRQKRTCRISANPSCSMLLP